jgi:dynein heavy chain
MSPTGSNLSERIRNFPSLVNCCTIDWFTSWPKEALQAVAAKFMEDTPFDDEVKEAIVQTCHMFHTESLDLSANFLRETKRTNYVTPTSYLDLMHIFQKLLDKQRTKLYDKKISYETGVDKLMSTAEAVT